MGILIKIPYIKQPNGSAKCGAACVAMLIKHYKKETVDINVIWEAISAISPELNRQYCKTHKIGAYISFNHFRCCTVRYNNLEELLDFCNSHQIAPIINHKSFENKIGGHFSVIKNLVNRDVVLNDPENKKRISVQLTDLETLAKKESENDEVGGNIAIIPILDKFELSSINCTHCNSKIDISFSLAINHPGQSGLNCLDFSVCILISRL